MLPSYTRFSDLVIHCHSLITYITCAAQNLHYPIAIQHQHLTLITDFTSLTVRCSLCEPFCARTEKFQSDSYSCILNFIGYTVCMFICEPIEAKCHFFNKERAGGDTHFGSHLVAFRRLWAGHGSSSQMSCQSKGHSVGAILTPRYQEHSQGNVVGKFRMIQQEFMAIYGCNTLFWTKYFTWLDHLDLWECNQTIFVWMFCITGQLRGLLGEAPC